MKSMVQRCLWTYMLSVAIVQAAKPIARHINAHVAPGQKAVIALPGYDADGHTRTATVVALPESGKLHQLSQIFSDYGYKPENADASIDVVPTGVTGSENRVVYVRPTLDVSPTTGKYGEFRYTVADASGTSNEGIVVLSVDTVTMRSSFDFNDEDWTLYQNGADSSKPGYEKTTTGGLSYYIYGTDALIQASDSLDDQSLWYFNAPSHFLGNHWDIYNGVLKFTLSAPAGDFSATNLNNAGESEFIVFDCASCDLKKGIRLVRRLDSSLTFDGSTQTFSITLNENSGWLKDSKSTIVAFTKPTQCEFVQVVSSLSAVRILGDFTKNYESVALDNVELHHGDGQPIACY